MSWRELIVPGTTMAKAFAELCEERIATHTKVCINPSASDQDIRQAQSNIAELQRIADVMRGDRKSI